MTDRARRRLWPVLTAALILLPAVYVLSIGPAYWLVFALPRQPWSPIGSETMAYLVDVYSYPASLAGGTPTPTNQFGIWLSDYMGWWIRLAYPPEMKQIFN